MNPPVVMQVGNVSVVREDLLPGGTKSRFIDSLFDDADELVYASPAQGGAQTALALAARRLNKRLTLFVAAAKRPHPRVVLSEKLGAQIVEVRMGFLSNVQAKARCYAGGSTFLRGRRVRNLEFGLNAPGAIERIAQAASQIPRPKQLWCAAGSGTLARGLAMAWPDVPRFVVQVGHRLTPVEVMGATVVCYPKPYAYQEVDEPPFPSDPTYERKAYKAMMAQIGEASSTFWNCASSAVEELDRFVD